MVQPLKRVEALENWLASQELLSGSANDRMIESVEFAADVEEYLSNSSDDFMKLILNRVLSNISNGNINYSHPSMLVWPLEKPEFKLSFDYDKYMRRVTIRELELINPIVTRALLAKELLNEDKGESAPSPAFKQKAKPPLCIPEDGAAKPYLGKRTSGDIRKWLENSYPYYKGGAQLTLAWLESHDCRAYRALYKQSTSETGPPSDFLSSTSDGLDRLLTAHNLDLSTDEGIEDAKRVHSALTSRLFPKKSLKRKIS